MQVAKVSKLLLLMEKGEGQNYRGKTLDEINISANDLISEEEEEEGDDIDDDFQEIDSSPNLKQKQTKEPILEKPYCAKKCPIIKKQKQNKNIKIILTENEKNVATQYFKTRIILNKAPKKHECEYFIKQNNISKPWRKIKDFVHNAANSYKNKLK